MMPEHDIAADATLWHIRLSDPAVTTTTWAEFTDWLEADAANAEAYDAVALADATLSDSIAIDRAEPQQAQNDNEAAPVKWYQRRSLMAVAASAVLALLVVPTLLTDRDLQAYETKAGQTRTIALSDGTQIAMNGGTRISIDKKSERFARLESGEAVFTVRHDAANPFTVETQTALLQDLGTVFNVRQDGDSLEVSVADGSVQYNPKAEAVTLSAGSQLQVSKDQPVPIVTRTDPAAMAGWRSGRLSYQNAKLSVIALDLSRSIGTNVTVSPTLANRRFTGLIRVDRDRELMFRRLEGLLGLRARHSAKGWQLSN
jgi:transmembrane sensor